ncbi:MAG TPA: hypothetical protein VEA15_03935 [Caulobacteraceae bacterium]|nr:hypothetical protein [Caulobacteraceae bacterium]
MTLTWDNAAEELVGKTIVVEIQHYDANNVFQRHEHAWGVCKLADEKKGVQIHLKGRTFHNKLMILPPKLTSFTKPPVLPGDYTLAGTGEQVTDPDWFATWSLIAKPDAKATPGSGPRG